MTQNEFMHTTTKKHTSKNKFTIIHCILAMGKGMLKMLTHD